MLNPLGIVPTPIDALPEIGGLQGINEETVERSGRADATRVEAGASRAEAASSRPALDLPQPGISANAAILSQPKMVAVYQDLGQLGTLFNDLTKYSNSVAEGTRPSTSISSTVDDTLALLVLLFKFAKDSRQAGQTQREIAVQTNVSTIQKQADEMTKQAMMMIGMAVVSGVMAVASLAGGAFSGTKNAQAVSKQKVGAADIAKNSSEIASLRKQASALATKAERGGINEQIDVLKNKNVDLQTNVVGKNQRIFDTRNTQTQLGTSINQSAGQMLNSGLQVGQQQAQAASKEEEISSTLAQNNKQKADELISYDINFLRDIVSLFSRISDSQNQAWKAAATVI